MSEQPAAGAAVEPEPKPHPEGKTRTKTSWVTIIVVVAIVVLLLLASVAYLLWKPEDEETLEVTVSPDPVQIDSGATVTLTANATFDGASINDALDASFDWSVSDGALGLFTSPEARTTNFVAGSEGGTGTITCNVSYVREGEFFNTTASVNLVVNPPFLATVSVTPPQITLIFDRAQIFSASAVDSVGDPLVGLDFTWTVEGIPAANYTLNSTTGASVNLTANITGTAWVNATASYNGVTKTGSALIPIIMAAPTMTMTWTNMPGGTGINWTCGEPTGPLAWDEVVIYLTDGTATVNWTITMGGLGSGSMNTTAFGSRVLGALAVFLNITDVSGNGSVNATDYFTFTTSGGKFNPAKNYIVTLVFSPSLDVIAQSTFRG